MKNNNFEFVSICYPYNKRRAIKINQEHIPLEEYRDFIMKGGIDQAEIVMPNLNVLYVCTMLKHLKISPSCNAPANYDFSPLYEMPEIQSLNCCNRYGNKNQYVGRIDYSRINGLVDLFVGINKGTLNYNRIETLKSLQVGKFPSLDISNLFCSKNLDTLRLIDCKVSSLKGIENAPKLQCLYLQYNRSLSDISALSSIAESLKCLRIENCSKIKDFGVLERLENLELLELSGSNELQNLDFLKSLKKLKTFVFSYNVVDGDLSSCLGLSYAFSERNRAHFNLKDHQLPKGEYIRGNETIEEWRRLE